MCNWKINSQTINVCNWRVHRKYLVKAPKLHNIVPASKPYVTDVLCNWVLNSQMIKIRVIILGPIIVEVVVVVLLFLLLLLIILLLIIIIRLFLLLRIILTLLLQSLIMIMMIIIFIIITIITVVIVVFFWSCSYLRFVFCLHFLLTFQIVVSRCFCLVFRSSSNYSRLLI